MDIDQKFMKIALKEAQKARDMDEVPIGAVAVLDGKVIARGHNTRESTGNAINHAEMIVIQKACKKVSNWRLDGVTLYVTIEPCPMCMG
ncbi:MAG: nucleoside deaminase, partial [Clostridia bacterium]|nr:nucleoside deaminase [Clostridia bacterium]